MSSSERSRGRQSSPSSRRARCRRPDGAAGRRLCRGRCDALDSSWPRSSGPGIREPAPTPACSPGTAPAGVAVATHWACPADVVIDFSLPGGGARDRRHVCGEARCRSSWPRRAWTMPSGMRSPRPRKRSRPPVAEHEPRGEHRDGPRGPGRAAALSGSASRADVEIIECHHRHKEDSPSGTALKFGAIVQAGDGADRGRPTAARGGPAPGRPTRSAITPSAPATIRASTRSSSAWRGNRFSVNVRATNRDCYARGALAAAAFLVGKPAGLYSMRDVLGIA